MFSLATLLIVAGSIIVLMSILIGYFVFENYKPSRRKREQDLREMRKLILSSIPELIPWSHEERNLLSFERIDSRTRRLSGRRAEGYFKNIYHEPVVAYEYRRYLSPKRYALLLMRTTEHEWVYYLQPDKISVYMDDDYLGDLTDTGILYDAKSRRAVARLSPDPEVHLQKVLVQGREVGNLINPAHDDRFNPRAFELLQPMNEREEGYFLALSLLQMTAVAAEER